MSAGEQTRLREQMDDKDVDTPSLFTLHAAPQATAESIIPTVEPIVPSNTSGSK
jgi:hypothetical protein